MTFENEMKGMLPEGFTVVEEVKLGDLSEVKEEKPIVPPTSNVRFLIKTASADDKNKNWRVLNLELRIVDGIQVGETVKYKNKPMFQRICYYAPKEGVNKKGVLYADCDWFQKKQHLIEFINLCKALGIDIKDVSVNDAFVTSLVGRYVKADIIIKPNTYTRADGSVLSEPKNEVVRFRKAEDVI